MGRKNFITHKARIQDFSQEIQTFFTIIPIPDSKPRLTFPANKCSCGKCV
nr:MAG TPA: hypothetical protein [Caudoviricetes sp.]